MKRGDNFTQTIVSTFGLIISVITAILPLFSSKPITLFFIDQKFAQPASFLSFMIGAAIIWQIIEFLPYPQFEIGKTKDRGKGYPEPWKRIGPVGIILILILLSIILSLIFLGLSEIKNNIILAVIQMFSYIGFFLCLITTFSILFSQTRQRFIWQENKESFTQTVFETLERNRLIKPWIEIYENRPMTVDEANNEGLRGLGLIKKIKVKTSIQEEEIIEFAVTIDGKEILKVLKKGK